MPRVLGKVLRFAKARKRKIVFCACAALSILLFALKSHLAFVAAGVLLTAAFAAALNDAVVRKIARQAALFSPRSRVRNVDCLLIGDTLGKDGTEYAGGIYVAVTAPDRSLQSSYEILRHTFCILKERSPLVVIFVKKRNLSKGYSLFDLAILSLSPTSVKRLGLEGLKKKSTLPLLFCPLRSLAFLFGWGLGRRFESEMEEIPVEIKSFCDERGIDVRIMTD